MKEFEIYASFGVGEMVEKTVDIRSDSGYALLMGEEEAAVERDYRRVVELQDRLLVVEEEEEEER